jgi:arginyl-tRNA synthetase
MNILGELQNRFRTALAGLVDDPGEYLKLVQPAADGRFGDYQANLAMPLGKRLGKPPRDVATQIVGQLQVGDLCESPTLAGPGFINLKLRDAWLSGYLQSLLADDRLGVPCVENPRNYVIDYSAPNVAKPMHVGHIRSTVIGAALDRTLRFLGHTVVSDNHIGDWGTQFGMILYGYKNFRDVAAYQQNPVAELSRLYRMVHQLVGYHEDLAALPELRSQIARQEKAVADLIAAPAPTDKAEIKHAAKALKRAEDNLDELRASLSATHERIVRVEANPQLERIARLHPQISAAVLAETAKLHTDDTENLQIWNEVLPACRDEIDRLYRRLNVSFDQTLGESFYHDRLSNVVEALEAAGIARESNGALCVFLEGYGTPFLIRKQDGAFLYSTTDLATIQYRMHTWQPDAILYVVDHRQSLHFEQLFATVRLWGFGDVELQHISFGTVLGDDGRPFKTRSGDTVGLEGLLDEAVSRALAIVSANDDAKPNGAELSLERRQQVAEAVGIGALKYADLSQNRTSDYVFSYDKMLAMNGNTATYMQYAHARVLSIFAKGGVTPEAIRGDASPILLEHPAERALALAIAQLPEALELVVADYRPNHLTSYLFELANRYSTFFENCPVLKADSEASRISRLKLCDLTARTIRLGLHLLGIEVVEKM